MREMQTRFESKFVLPADALGAFLDRLGADYLILAAGTKRLATYQSLYFDTPGLEFFHAHRRGRRIRHKVRIRHYPDREMSVLEVKTRRSDRLTVKERAERTFGDSTLGTDDLVFVRRHVPSAMALVPQVWVVYGRMTLLGVRSCERITIDVGLTVSRGGQQRGLRGAAIVEAKQPRPQLGTVAMTALRRAGARSGSASKYCTALSVTCPDLPNNRIRESLRTLTSVGTWAN